MYTGAPADARGRAVEADLLRFVSMRSKIQPEEIGDMAVFLAGDAARYVTGQIVSVCGDIEWEA